MLTEADKTVEGVKQWHGNRRWILQTWKSSSALQRQCWQSSNSTNSKLNVSWKSTKTTKTFPFAPSPHTSDECWTGQSRTAYTSSHFAKSWHLACRALEAYCWSNNVANSHRRRRPFNSRVMCSCLVPQCAHPPHLPSHQRRLANWDKMPVSYTSGQCFHLCRHPTCWTSSQWSHTVSSTPSHGFLTSSPLSALLSIEWACTTSQIETPILYPPLNNSWVHLTTITEVRWNAERLECTKRLLWTFTPGPPSWNGTAENSVQYSTARMWPKRSWSHPEQTW